MVEELKGRESVFAEYMCDGGTERIKIARIYQYLLASCPPILFRRMKLMLSRVEVDFFFNFNYSHSVSL